MSHKIRSLVIAASLLFASQQTAYGAAAFLDVASNHPHYTAINYLYENGIVEGYSDNTFRPGQMVNRAEALKIILLGSDIFVPEIQPQDIFPDVIHGSWYAKYASKAKNLGIVSGDSDTGMFRPGDTVNLAEALKILLNTNKIDTEAPDGHPYPDVPPDAWFAPYFEYARKIGLLDQTSSQDVNPALAIDRGMLAELMYRLSQKPEGYAEGEASYYGEKFHGKTTASGEVFDASKFTAAHRTFPFGTWLKVTNLANGKSALVRVNDRGPYAGENRIIDLSKAAFESISPLSAGLINVSIVPVSAPAGSTASAEEEESGEETETSAQTEEPVTEEEVQYTPEAPCTGKEKTTFYNKNSFDNITLDKEIPSQLIEGEVLTLSGSTASSAATINAFIVDDEGSQTTFPAEAKNHAFKGLNVFFPKTGKYKLGIIPGVSGSSIVQEINVLASGCLEEKDNKNLTSPSGLSLDLTGGNTVLTWERGDYPISKITFQQGKTSHYYFLRNVEEFIPPYRDFVDFKEDTVNISIQGADSGDQFLSNVSSVVWSAPITASFKALTHYTYIINSDQVTSAKVPDRIKPGKSFQISFKPEVSINTNAAIILPDGSVAKTPLESEDSSIKNKNATDIFPPSENELILNYTPKTDGVYFAEINNENGLASINIPLYPPDGYPLLPNPTELTDNQSADLGDDIAGLRNQMLKLVNADRIKHGKKILTLNGDLNTLAQFRSDDMAENNYFSHWDESGLGANDLRKNYAISQVVAENIAKDITLELAEYGLMRSALHRDNILNDDWTLAGFGISRASDGSYIFVQIFSSDPVDLEDITGLREDVLEVINENRNSNLSLKDTFNYIAQQWSEDMVNRDYFDFTNPDGENLVDIIREEGVNTSIGNYIVGNTSFEDAKAQIAENSQLADPKWSYIGIGIAQDDVGIIKITLIYSE